MTNTSLDHLIGKVAFYTNYFFETNTVEEIMTSGPGKGPYVVKSIIPINPEDPRQLILVQLLSHPQFCYGIEIEHLEFVDEQNSELLIDLSSVGL